MSLVRLHARWCAFLALLAAAPVLAQDAAKPEEPKKIAAIVTAYYRNSHADVIVSRLLQTDTLDGTGAPYDKLKLVSLYTDQVPARDISRKLMAKHNVPIYAKPADALTLGTGKLAVDGVLFVCEHGDYPRSAAGQIQYPKRRLFEEIVKVFDANGRGVPVFCDKHLSDTWKDAEWIYEQSRRLKFPMMAGSSLPLLWRYPPLDVPRDAKLKEVLALSYHTLDAYGFHGLEMLQCMIERRSGGEAGVKAVQCYVDDAVWQAGEQGVYDKQLFEAAVSRLSKLPQKDKSLKELVKDPVLFVIEYENGPKACMLTLNGAVADWTVAWRREGSDQIDSTRFETQEARPFMHFGLLTRGVEQMFLTGKPSWPVERTLMTSGLLDALLASKAEGGKRLETPHLKVAYRSGYDWRQPTPRPTDRPIEGQ